MPQMYQAALAEIKALEVGGDTANPRYMQLLREHYYVHHILRMPADDWPDPGGQTGALGPDRGAGAPGIDA